MSELLNSEEAARILEVHPRSVLNYVRWGQLAATKLGRDWVIKKSDIAAFELWRAEQEYREQKERHLARLRKHGLIQ
jgi:excisionase family DNA binding protein